MKTLSFLLVVSCVIYFNSIINAWQTIAPSSPKRNPGGCYHEQFGHMKDGDDIPSEYECVHLTCTSNGDIILEGCDIKFQGEVECYFNGSPEKPWPLCCTDVYC